MRRSTLLATALVCTLAALPAFGQPAPLQFKQDRDGADVKLLTAGDVATLGDPMFTLLLKEKANVVKLSEIEKAVQPDGAKRKLFVVDERIVGHVGGGRRAVLAFGGANGGEELQGNVMLSVSFGRDGPDEVGEVEAWGWDNHRGRYNYYKLDGEGSADGQLSWKFRGSSEKADLLTPAERKGTCMRCHVNGAPIMKELVLPWNNWHSSKFKADYLVAGSTHPNKWPAANTPRFKISLAVADRLEVDFFIPAVKRFNQSRINAALKRDDATGDRAVAAGRLTVLEGRRLLRPVFQTTEVNLTSSAGTSGFHPAGAATDFVPDLKILIPDNFFLNTKLMLGGLQLAEAAKFRTFGSLTQAENKQLVEKLKVRLDGAPGDTHFGWFVPEPSFIDNDAAEQLLKAGVVTPHFLAAALAVDLEAPVFSAKRAGLLKFVPDRFEFKPVPSGTDPTTVPRDAEADLLTKAVVAAIDQAAPPAGSPAAEFRALLKKADAVAELKQRIDAYAARVKGKLADGTARPAELERLYNALLDRRRAMLQHPVLKNLDETGGRLLLPLPAGP